MQAFNLDENYSLKVVEDRNELLPLAMAMHQESPYKDYPMRESVVDIPHIVIGLYYQTELVGFLGALLVDNPLVEIKLAFEHAWYVLPEHRGKHSLKLIEAYEVWAKMQGAEFAQVCHMNTDSLDKVYEKLGYKLYEKVFLKCLH